MNRRISVRSLPVFLVCVFWSSAQPWAAVSNSRLPDGTEFHFWEQPLRFSRTYYVDGNSPKSDDNGPGTADWPLRTINKAAQVLQPGERVVVAAGTYRECVRPARGGTDPAHMISYEAAPGAKVIVKGSEILSDGWQPSAIPTRGAAAGAGGQINIRKHELTGAMFPDAYNPFGRASGDKRVPGPIIDPGAGPTRHVDPRVTAEARK